ncbi:MAG: UDP-N-acetylglucosamine 2-epimerase, partial [Legionellaceae bacterium]|nr:UDP-N-acetylglucosamine 2-epimerase [Legionellaceae bacterium]
MRKIAVFTGTRAEYGLLYWLLKAIQNDNELVLQLIVSGMHLSPQYGETWREIEADGFSIDATVEMLLSSDSSVGVVKSMGLATIGFADALARLQPDLLVILGDRFEALAVAQAALIMNIPIAHIHGGELTLGAYDNSIRHAITKMALLHFVAAQEYYARVVQMGEEATNVFNVGAPGLEHIVRNERLSFCELKQSLDIDLRQPYILVTYHPVTLDAQPTAMVFETLLNILDEKRDHCVLFTYPNADNHGYTIIQKLEQYCRDNPKRAFAVKSLGYKRYLSAVEHADVVIGNSSSGIIEVP